MSGRVFDLRLNLVIDPDHCSPCSPEEVALQAIQGGATILQLRSKAATVRDFVDLGAKIKLIADQFNVPLLINDRVDVAFALGAAGVHVGQSDLHPEHARRLLGETAIIGFSVSAAAQAKAARDLSIDYLGAGPIFPTQTKTDWTELSSLAGLKEICESTSLPVVAIGGIDFHNAVAVRNAGASGIAVVSAICGQADPQSAARKLRSIYPS